MRWRVTRSEIGSFALPYPTSTILAVKDHPGNITWISFALPGTKCIIPRVGRSKVERQLVSQ
jgi:hypothetical protein